MAEAFGLAVNCLTVIDLTVKVSSKLYDYGKNAANARENINRLHDKVLTLQKIARSIQALLDTQENFSNLPTMELLRQTVHRAEGKLHKLNDSLEVQSSRQPMRMFGFRSLKWPFKSQDVERLVADLHECFQMLSQSLQVDQTSLLLNMDRRSIIHRIPHAEDAAYDSRVEEQNPVCHPHTRSGILSDIREWTDDPYAKSIFWLNGMAGTGKSTISRTVARSLAQTHSLGASFFFKRGESNRGDSGLFFSTLAFQLASNVPGYGQALKRILNDNPTLTDKSLRDQFNRFLVEPLSSLSIYTEKPTPLILIVDALDECANDNDIRMIIYLLSSTELFPNRSWRLRTFLTSRPELPIRLGFGAVRGTFQDLILHNIPNHIVEQDILVFLRDKMENIRSDYNLTVSQHRQLPSDWPGQVNIQLITSMATPLFIVAATVCRFVSERRSGSPREQLAKIVNYPSGHEASKLEGIYLPILDQTIAGLSVTERDIALSDFRYIVGTIILAYTPLSSRGLASFLQISEEKVESRLDLLHSCLNVPSEPELPVRLLHLSFRDFLVDPSRKGQTMFWVDQRATHFEIAERCLEIMDRLLQRDICQISHNESRVDFGDFQKGQKVPEELEYACLHWVDHLVQAGESLRDDHRVYRFLGNHLLHWIEAYCIVAKTSGLLALIQGLLDLVETTNADAIKEFLDDTFRIVSTNWSMIRKYPLQVYSSMLLFAPTNSIVRKTFAFEMPSCVSIKTKLNPDWDPLLMAFDYGQQYGIIQALSWSHDDTCLAAISSTGQIHVWDVMSGQTPLSLPALGKTRIEFSNTTEFLAASGEREIELYRRATGKAVQTIGNFGCWAFAKDAPFLATTSDDGDIRLWKVTSGALVSPFLQVQVLRASEISVSWINVYHDGITIASAYQDYHVKLWHYSIDANASNHKKTQPACLGSVFSPKSFFRNKYAKVILSPNSRLVAFITPGSVLANKVEICCAINGELLQAFESDYSIQDTIIFSPDSQFVARDSGKGTVEVRLSVKDTSIMSLSHQGATCAAFSHDSNRLAVARWLGSVQISSIAQAGLTQRKQTNRPRKLVSRIQLSPNSQVLAIIKTEGDIELWDTTTGAYRQTLRAKPSAFDYLAFSPDSNILAYCGAQEIKAWKVDTGECIGQNNVNFKSQQSGEINLFRVVCGFPDLDPESAFLDDQGDHFNIQHLATFGNYSVLYGHIEYLTDTKDLMMYHLKTSELAPRRARVLRYSDGKWISRGLQLETKGSHIAKLSENGEFLVVFSSMTQIVVQDLTRSQILLDTVLLSPGASSGEIRFPPRDIRETTIPYQHCSCPRFVLCFQPMPSGSSYQWRTVDVCVCAQRSHEVPRIGESVNDFRPYVMTLDDKEADNSESAYVLGTDDWIAMNSKFLMNLPPNYRMKRSPRRLVSASDQTVAIITISDEILCIQTSSDEPESFLKSE
ncbi:unnamed protein product [Clonostachys rosea]|uniref:NACHT domain-containing protein n=1 Tax=Bionectria ochroleuca TaxID=29856 RepID=A0ABY6UM79_BIOOC|nr:unnamed protein product [Clonostachys rosea]